MSTALANSPSPGSREKILDVAEVLFARQGFAGISMNDVASPVGLSKSSLFHHFSGKLELYAEVCERVLGRIAARVRPVLEGSSPCAERLDAAVGALMVEWCDHKSLDGVRLELRAQSGLRGDSPPPRVWQPWGKGGAPDGACHQEVAKARAGHFPDAACAADLLLSHDTDT